MIDPQLWDRVKLILDLCLDLEPSDRASLLDEACGDDAGLRREVESLLASHDQAGDFIANPILRESFTGVHLGPWKILSDIGEGGMSRVCLTERDDGQFQQRAAVKILQNCASSLPPGGRVLIIEFVLPRIVDQADPALEPCLMSDLNMLTATGGQERTEAEYAALLDQAGLHKIRTVKVDGHLASVIEASHE